MNTTDPAPGDQLDPRDESLAALLATGKTLTEAAAALGVSLSTVQRSWRRPEVQGRVRELRVEAAAVVCGRLLSGAAGAVDELLALAKSGTRADAVRLRACVAVVQLTLSNVAMADLAAEMKELRELLAADRNRHTDPGWKPPLIAPALTPGTTPEARP